MEKHASACAARAWACGRLQRLEDANVPPIERRLCHAQRVLESGVKNQSGPSPLLLHGVPRVPTSLPELVALEMRVRCPGLRANVVRQREQRTHLLCLLELMIMRELLTSKLRFYSFIPAESVVFTRPTRVLTPTMDSCIPAPDPFIRGKFDHFSR